MAVVEIWNRGVIPEGRVAIPSSENPITEQFGKGMQTLGQAGTQAAYDVVRAENIAEDNAWRSEQPEVAKAIAQAGVDSQQAIADIKAKLPADLAGYQEEVGKYWDTQKGELFKKFSSPRAQDYIDLQMIGLKGSDIAAAVKDSTAAKFKVRGDAVQATLDLGANTLISRPDQYEVVMSNVMATIDGQKGDVPEATLNEWRTKGTQNLTAAMLGGQIERDPISGLKQIQSGKWDERITPQQKVSLVKVAEAGIREKQYQADRAQAAAEKAQREQSALKLSDLQIAISRNEAGYQDIEKAYDQGKGWLQPDDRARLTIALDTRGEKDAKAAAGLNFVAGAKTGAYQVDPKSPEQMEAVNADYLNQVKLWTAPDESGQPSRTPEQIASLTQDYVETVGVIPEALQSQLRGQIRNGNNQQVISAANTIEQFRQTNPALLDDFAKEDIERASMITSQVASGVDPAQAVNNVLALQKMDKATVEGRKDEYDALTKPSGSVTRFQATQGELQGAINSLWQQYVPFKTNPAVPAEMVAQYDQLKREAYQRTGDMGQAQKSATDALKRVWGQSAINGTPTWMKSPPENFYSAPANYGLRPDQNSEWMKRQLVDEFTANAAIDLTAGPAKDRLAIVPSNRVDERGRPLYSVMFRDSLGNVGPAVDARGVPLLWAPDWDKSATKKELDAAKAKEIELLKKGVDPSLPYSDQAKEILSGKQSKAEVPPGPWTLSQMTEAELKELKKSVDQMTGIKPTLQSAMPEPEQPDQLAADEMSAEPGIAPEMAAIPAFLAASMHSATTDELQILVKQARSESVRAAVAAELARRSKGGS